MPLRSGGAQGDEELARRKEDEEKKEKKEKEKKEKEKQTSLIKSNNPHLAGVA